jgi:hypothetical protein
VEVSQSMGRLVRQLPLLRRSSQSHLVRGTVAVALVILTAYWVWAWWTSPEHRIAQFIAAVQAHDSDRMLAMAAPEEVQRLGLTPEKLTQMLSDPGGALASGTIRDAALPPVYNGRSSAWVRAVAITVMQSNSNPAITPSGPEAGHPARSYVIAHHNGGSWRIALSNFIYQAFVARTGASARWPRYTGLCARNGVRPELYVPEDDRWELIPSASQPSVPQRLGQ